MLGAPENGGHEAVRSKREGEVLASCRVRATGVR
jgi:hypothetical protein